MNKATTTTTGTRSEERGRAWPRGWVLLAHSPVGDLLNLTAHLEDVVLGLDDVGPGHQEERIRGLGLFNDIFCIRGCVEWGSGEERRSSDGGDDGWHITRRLKRKRTADAAACINHPP